MEKETMKITSVFAASLLFLACGKAEAPNTHPAQEKPSEHVSPKVDEVMADPAPEPTPEPPPPPPEPNVWDMVLAANSLDGALKVTQPLMGEKFNEDSTGTMLLAVWAMKKLTWDAVSVKKDETSFKLVMKDSEEEKGKRLCVRGTIIQIAVDRSELGKVYKGLLVDRRMQIYRFFAAGSTGSLVGMSKARFCGVVTGRYDYSNSAGGTGHAISLVGMFDLKGNRGG